MEVGILCQIIFTNIIFNTMNTRSCLSFFIIRAKKFLGFFLGPALDVFDLVLDPIF